jgi:hypothetical protein
MDRHRIPRMTIPTQIDPRVEGRPARRYYRLTPDGMELARAALARAYTSARPAWLRPVGEEP